MKETTVHSLVIARTLLERAEGLCMSEDRYLASAGLVILQDALETVLYALLIEKGIDEEKNLERKGFDDLIAELRAANVPVPKSGTLKALNKQRVLTKHYAQVAEPVTVRTYHEAAVSAIEAICLSVIGKSVRELFVADLLQDSEAKTYLKNSESAISNGKYLHALVETRKALFVEFEEEYNIYGWRDYERGKEEGLLGTMIRGGWSAPYWTRNSEWIAKNVKVPTDYIQIDLQHWRLKAMELGIHTVELQNLQKLTPQVFRIKRGKEWSVTYNVGFPASNANENNARYCLDRAVWMILKKQEHSGVRREPSENVQFDPPPIYIGRVVFEAPSTQSRQVHVVSEGFNYTIKKIVGGFDPNERFYEIFAESEAQDSNSLLALAEEYYRGFLQILDEDEL
jgi:hypothetical protein